VALRGALVEDVLLDRFQRIWSRFLLSDNVRRAPRANPAAAVINSRMAWGITTVAKSKCVATGSRFWTTMIATKIARIEAVMSFKLRIK
jgi:anaerobic glycerol-3-phosphate dehydrogenase